LSKGPLQCCCLCRTQRRLCRFANLVIVFGGVGNDERWVADHEARPSGACGPVDPHLRQLSGWPPTHVHLEVPCRDRPFPLSLVRPPPPFEKDGLRSSSASRQPVSLQAALIRHRLVCSPPYRGSTGLGQIRGRIHPHFISPVAAVGRSIAASHADKRRHDCSVLNPRSRTQYTGLLCVGPDTGKLGDWTRRPPPQRPPPVTAWQTKAQCIKVRNLMHATSLLLDKDLRIRSHALASVPPSLSRQSSRSPGSIRGAVAGCGLRLAACHCHLVCLPWGVYGWSRGLGHCCRRRRHRQPPPAPLPWTPPSHHRLPKQPRRRLSTDPGTPSSQKVCLDVAGAAASTPPNPELAHFPAALPLHRIPPH